MFGGNIKIIIGKEEWAELGEEGQEYLKRLLREKHDKDINFIQGDDEDEE